MGGRYYFGVDQVSTPTPGNGRLRQWSEYVQQSTRRLATSLIRRSDARRLNKGGVVDTAIRFWDRIAERYAAQPVPDEAAYHHKLALTA
ncbi:MAG: hypothetical protein AAFX85_12420, partial [Pseudomonadota bacterium]